MALNSIRFLCKSVKSEKFIPEYCTIVSLDIFENRTIVQYFRMDF